MKHSESLSVWQSRDRQGFKIRVDRAVMVQPLGANPDDADAWEPVGETWLRSRYERAADVRDEIPGQIAMEVA